MTEVVFKQRKEIVVLEYAQYEDLNHLIEASYLGAPRGASVGPLKWVDGIVMIFNPLPATNESMMNQLIEGRLFWDYLAFAPMPKYVPNKVSDALGISCSIADVSSVSTFRDIAKAIHAKFLASEGK